MRKHSPVITLILVLTVILCFSAVAMAQPITDSVVMPWQNRAADILTNDIVATILLIVGLSGIIIEIVTVGSFGLFGAVGVLAFAAYFLGIAWDGSLNSLAIWLLVAGIILLAVEIFAVPGFGLPGGLGIIGIIASLLIASPNPAAAVWELLIALAVSVFIVWFTVKNRRTRKVWNKLILGQKLDSASGYDSADPSLTHLLGKQGTAQTTLRPSGSAIIEGNRVDVVTNGEFINAGTAIKVVLVEGVRVVVAPLDSQTTDADATTADKA